MTPEFKAKWIQALRDGKYQQTRGVLKDSSGGMCCLGVAADLVDSSGWTDQIMEGSQGHYGFGWRVDGPTLCEAVAHAIGIPTEEARELALRNDGGGKYSPHSFADIADLIEERL